MLSFFDVVENSASILTLIMIMMEQNMSACHDHDGMYIEHDNHDNCLPISSC